MRPENDIKRFIDKAAVRTSHKADKAVLDALLTAHRQTKENASAGARPGMRSIVMRSSFIKFACAAAIVGAVVLGLSEFCGMGSKSGVAWAEVGKKLEASQGVVGHIRMRIAFPNKPDQVAYFVFRNKGPRTRHDLSLQPGGQPFRSIYSDSDAKTSIEVDHSQKTCLRAPLADVPADEQGQLEDPKVLVRKFLSHKYTKLGRETIDGVSCEGIEVTDPNFVRSTPPATSFAGRLWVSMETGYPVRMEHSSAIGGGQVQVLCDQFEWDANVDPRDLEPNIPPDYRWIK
jgi:hypothetical protein